MATDHHILDHYLEKKYYLWDPNIDLHINEQTSSWQITLGSDCEIFSENGFLYDLYKIFSISCFVRSVIISAAYRFNSAA